MISDIRKVLLVAILAMSAVGSSYAMEKKSGSPTSTGRTSPIEDVDAKIAEAKERAAREAARVYARTLRRDLSSLSKTGLSASALLAQLEGDECDCGGYGCDYCCY